MKAELTAERLRELLHYNPEEGVFVFKMRRGRMMPGALAGCIHSEGYWKIQIDGVYYLAHRLAWLYVYGEWTERIDHINRNRIDNRWVNLRSASAAVNAHNRGEAARNNRLGVMGVRARGSRFAASITVGRRNRHLGSFDTAEAAHHAYVMAKRALHEGCAI